MKGRLLALGVPTFIVAALLGGSWAGVKKGWIPGGDATWAYLWPSLIALGLLAFAVGALLIRARRLAWPLLAGFVAQLVGILLFALRAHEKPFRMLWWTGGAILLAALIVILDWLRNFIRARRLEKRIRDGQGGDGVDEQKIQQIRKDMQEALALLRRAGAGRNAIYELPWFLVIGRSQAGKTIAITHSGLGLPVKKDRLKGVGGTHTCDWFFTNDLIFMDTPGAWVTDGTSEEAQQYWRTLLKDLRRFRGRRPLDGLVVVVPADDLLSKTDEELRQQAENIREVIDLLHDELHFRFPVYLLVSKCDLVEGFVDFFRSVPPQRWHEILGWSNPDPNEGGPVELIPRAFRRVLRRLRAYRLELVARIGGRRRARKIFFFPEEFKRVERPLVHFADVLFYEDPSHETPVFRGFYFSSGTQGEGSILGPAMQQLARGLGVRLTAGAGEEKEEPKRSYFLLELFRHLMVGDEGLVSRTAGHWWKRRRDTMFAAFLPACIAGLFLLLAAQSFLLNSCTYRGIGNHVPRLVDEIRRQGSEPKGTPLVQVLENLDWIRNYHDDMTGPTFFRGFGMRQPGQLAPATFRVFRDQFESAVLRPTLEAASRAVSERSSACSERLDLLHAVVWLRGGHRFESKGELRPLERFWNVSTEDATKVRKLFLDQYGYLESESAQADLLPGFSLYSATSALKADCLEGTGPALDAYLDFQRSCRERPGRPSAVDCFNQLRKAVGGMGQDSAGAREKVQQLQGGLYTLSAERERRQPEADRAYDLLKGIDVGATSGDPCRRDFESQIAKTLHEAVAQQEKLIEDCQAQVPLSPNPAQTGRDVVYQQFKTEEDAIKKAMSDFNNLHRDSLTALKTLDPSLVPALLREYRQTRCVRTSEGATPAGVVAPSQERPRAPASRAFTWLVVPSAPGEDYTKSGWLSRRIRWDDDLKSAEKAPQTEMIRERKRVRNAVDNYAARYVEEWLRYLQGLRVKNRHGEVPAWLKALAETDEFFQALEPARDALRPELDAGSELDAFGSTLGRLGAVTAFAETGVGEYQNHLRKVASDLEKCSEDPSYSIDFRNKLESEGNSVYDARQWVASHAGSNLAQAALRDFLMTPIDEAGAFLKTSSKVVITRWDELVRACAALKNKVPFAPADKADGVASARDMKKIFGAEAGLVPALIQSGGSGLSEAARDWLDEISPLAELFFDPTTNAPKPLRVQLSHLVTSFDPPKLGEDYRLEELKLTFSGGVEFRWSQAEPTVAAKIPPLDLLGEDSSTYSVLLITPSEKAGLVKTKWEKLAPAETSVQGPWATLRLLGKGLPPGTGGSADSLTLKYSASIPYKRKQPGKLVVTIQAEDKGLGRLLRIAEKGLTLPPTGTAAEPPQP